MTIDRQSWVQTHLVLCPRAKHFVIMSTCLRGFNKYQQSMFGAKLRKIMCRVYYIKLGV